MKLNFPPSVKTGTPLLRILYRDSESLANILLVGTRVNCLPGIAFFIVLFGKYCDSQSQR